MKYFFEDTSDYSEKKTGFKNNMRLTIMNDLDFFFINACKNRDLETIKGMLLLENGVDIRTGNDFAVHIASVNGDLPLLKYLLTSPDLKEHCAVQRYECQGSIFKAACKRGHVDIVDYLLSSPDIKDYHYVSMNELVENDYYIFWHCTESVKRYLLFNHYIELTDEFVTQLLINDRSDLLNEINAVRLKNKLDYELNNKPITKKKVKI